MNGIRILANQNKFQFQELAFSLPEAKVDMILCQHQLLTTLKQPNLWKIFDIVKQDQKLLVYTEYFENGTLSQVLSESKGPLAENVAKNYSLQILNALEFLHKRDKSLGELNPQNLHLRNNGNLKLNFIRDLMHRDARYYSPELLENSRVDTRFADVWALGCIVFEMLTGKRLFESAETVKSEMKKIDIQKAI